MKRVFAAALPGLVVLTLIAQFSQAAHFVLVEHSLCAEHGELVHGASHAHASADAASNSVSSKAHDDPDHEHCPTLLNSKNRIAPPACADVARIAELREHSATNATQAFVVVDVLRRAPKSSPPA